MEDERGALDLDRVMQLIDEYKLLLDDKEQLAETVKRNIADLTRVRDALAEAMVEAEIEGVTRHGVTWRLKPTTLYRKRGGDDEAFLAAIRGAGLGDLIHETVNAQTLQGAMAELAAQCGGELPAELQPVINTYEYMDISHRKASRR